MKYLYIKLNSLISLVCLAIVYVLYKHGDFVANKKRPTPRLVSKTLFFDNRFVTALLKNIYKRARWNHQYNGYSQLVNDWEDGSVGFFGKYKDYKTHGDEWYEEKMYDSLGRKLDWFTKKRI